jgi:hypothetical protein
MLNRVLFSALIGIFASVAPVYAGSDIDEMLDATRQGKYLCLTPDPVLGCQSYSLLKMQGSLMSSSNEVITAANPPVVVLFSSTQSLPEADNCWLIANDTILEGPTFYRGDELLSEIERGMFEDNFNNMILEKKASSIKVCAVFSDGPKGRMIAYSYDGKVPEDPPVYFSYHTRDNLPPLALGVKSLLLAK